MKRLQKKAQFPAPPPPPRLSPDYQIDEIHKYFEKMSASAEEVIQNLEKYHGGEKVSELDKKLMGGWKKLVSDMPKSWGGNIPPKAIKIIEDAFAPLLEQMDNAAQGRKPDLRKAKRSISLIKGLKKDRSLNLNERGSWKDRGELLKKKVKNPDRNGPDKITLQTLMKKDPARGKKELKRLQKKAKLPKLPDFDRLDTPDHLQKMHKIKELVGELETTVQWALDHLEHYEGKTPTDKDKKVTGDWKREIEKDLQSQKKRQRALPGKMIDAIGKTLEPLLQQMDNFEQGRPVDLKKAKRSLTLVTSLQKKKEMKRLQKKAHMQETHKKELIKIAYNNPELRNDLLPVIEKLSKNDEDKTSQFEKGKPADPTKNMSPEDTKKWWSENEKNKDNFK